MPRGGNKVWVAEQANWEHSTEQGATVFTSSLVQRSQDAPTLFQVHLQHARQKLLDVFVLECLEPVIVLEREVRTDVVLDAFVDLGRHKYTDNCGRGLLHRERMALRKPLSTAHGKEADKTMPNTKKLGMPNT